MTTRDPGPGDRQDKETAVAFEAFRCYLEMGTERSTAKVARQLGKTKSLIDRWSSRWKWVDRVREYEGEAISAADQGLLEEIAKRSRRQAEISQLHQEALALPSREVLRRLQEDPENAAKALSNMGLRDLIPMAASAARAHARVVATERLALGMSTDNLSSPDSPRTAAEERVKRLSDEALGAELLGVDELAQRRQAKARKAKA